MNKPNPYPYATHLDIKFPALDVVDVPSLVKACTDKWSHIKRFVKSTIRSFA